MFSRIGTIEPLQGLSQNKALGSGVKFRLGESFKGSVLQRFPDGEVLVKGKGGQFRAHADAELVQGRSYEFEVKSTGPRVELKAVEAGRVQGEASILLGNPGKAGRERLSGILLEISQPHNMKGLNQDAAILLKQVGSFLPLVIGKAAGDTHALRLSRFLMGCGLFWETKVARHLLEEKGGSWRSLIKGDLKGLLLFLEKALQRAGGNNPQTESLSEKVREAIQLIEQEQLANLYSLAEGAGWCLYVPGSPDKGFKGGEALVKKRRPEDVLQFSMLLDFTWLGQVEVRASLLKTVMNLSIHLQDQERLNYVEENLGLLKKALQGVGIQVGKISCGLRAEENAEQVPVPDEDPLPISVHVVI